MINELPTVFDVVTGKKPVKEKLAVNNISGTKAKPAAKVVSTEKLPVRPYYYECVVLSPSLVGTSLLSNLQCSSMR